VLLEEETELALLLDVLELDVVDVDDVLVQPAALCTVKFPRRPMATSWMGALPVLLTWTVTVVTVPADESPTSLAETWPLAAFRSEWSCVVSCCLEPTVSSWWVIWEPPFTIATADGIIWYPVGVFTMTGFSSSRAAVVPPTSAGFPRVTWKVVLPVAKVTAELVPLTPMEIPVTVKLTE